MVETGSTQYMMETEEQNTYKLTQEILGKGSFSVVKSAINMRTQERVAAKIIDLMKNKDIFAQEVNALSRLNHDLIVKLLHSRVNEDGKGVIFLEYISWPSLQTFLSQRRTPPLDVVLQVFAQLVEVLDHMHKHNVAHSDLKPENIAFDPRTNSLKLFDFGLSQTLPPNTRSSSFVGSPLYMAPEVLLREEYNPFAADVWSLAIVLIELLTGKTPFSSFSCMDELLDFVSFETFVPIPESIPADLRELLRKMLDFNPTTRLSIGSVKDFINHFM